MSRITIANLLIISITCVGLLFAFTWRVYNFRIQVDFDVYDPDGMEGTPKMPFKSPTLRRKTWETPFIDGPAKLYAPDFSA